MNPFTSEIELTKAVNLCAPDGRLNPQAIGFSRKPLHTCNLSGYAMRKKRWNYWAITTPDFMFSVTISDIDYLGMIFAYFLDLNTKEFIEQTVITPFGAGVNLDSRVEEKLIFENKGFSACLDDSGDMVRINVRSSNFGGKTMQADFTITRRLTHETLNVVIPWSPDRFQFTSKQTCLPAVGEVKIGERVFPFTGKDTYACLDFGRGIWKYQTTWNWISFAGMSGQDVIGVNLGAQWTDGTGYTENGLIINGRLVKIGTNTAITLDEKDLMKPWVIKTEVHPAVDLVFTPVYERVAKTDLGILKSVVHQMIGHFNGTLVDEGGKVYPVKNLVGWSEGQEARW